MELFIIAIVALIASLLTFFSGFGLGTILTPVLIIFFPVEVAIAITGIVHLLTKVFKIFLVAKQINWRVGFKFGITAIIGAFVGAKFLLLFLNSQALYTYTIHDKIFSVTAINLLISILMIIFALFEVIPSLQKIQFNENKLYAGGLLSGFFGGLSGNQGALRSMFLLRSGLTKEGYIATGVLIACAVDITRLSVYFTNFSNINLEEKSTVLIVAVLSAFAGSYLGNILLKKVTFSFVQWLTTVMIIILAIGLGTGLI